MPFEGTQYNLLYDFEADKNAGRPSSLIRALRVQSQLQDMADVLTSLSAFAQGTASPIDLDMGNHKVGSLATDKAYDSAATVKQALGSAEWAGSFGGTADALVATVADAPVPFDGMKISGIITANNTITTPQLNLNGEGLKDITDYKGDPVGANALVLGARVSFTRVGTKWRWTSAQGGAVSVVTDKTLSGNGGGTPLTSIVAPEVVTFSGAISLDFAPLTKSPVKEITLTGNTVISATNLTAGEAVVIRLIQDATGGRTVTWGAEFVWAGGLTPVITTTANGVTIVAGLVRDATHIDMGMSVAGAATAMPTRQIFTASGTWTKPTGVRRVRVRVQGGGGGGGGAAGATSQVALGVGGGAGGFAEHWLDVSAISSVAVTVGAGGAGNSGADGSNGGTTSFGAHASASGGAGGSAGASGTSLLAFTGGAAGSASAGDIQANGQPGQAAIRLSGTVGVSGSGGNAALGGGGRHVVVNGSGSASGTAGGGFGSGGGGGAAVAAVNVSGGAGAGGIVIVEEFY